MELFSIIETLENLLESSAAVPLTGKNLVDKEEVLELLKEIKANLPEEIKRAQNILDTRDSIIKEAQNQANDVLSDADKAIDMYIKEHEITKEAYKKANDIVLNAQKNAKEIRTGTREYAEGILIQVQDILNDTINVIDSNREELRN